MAFNFHLDFNRVNISCIIFLLFWQSISVVLINAVDSHIPPTCESNIIVDVCDGHLPGPSAPPSNPHECLALRNSYASEFWSDEEVAEAFKKYNGTGKRTVLNHLVIVPCHSIYLGSPSSMILDFLNVSEKTNCSIPGTDTFLEGGWVLEKIQKERKQLGHFIGHLKAGLSRIADDPASLLVISGGQTRFAVPMSEATSYISYAIREHLFNFSPDFRVITEDFARDSFENLLFSIVRFYQYTGKYPKRITVIGFPFKGARFVGYHREALNFPKERFEYLGLTSFENGTQSLVPCKYNGPINTTRPDGPEDPFWENSCYAAYRDTAIPFFEEDPYGCGEVLMNKKKSRNPYRNTVPYEMASPELLPYFCTNTIA